MAYAYPGVYIEEDSSPGLTISSSATAVPVFVFVPIFLIGSIELLKVDSWLEFLSLFPPVGDFDDYAGDPLYSNVKYYFLNGGGRCYVSDSDYVCDNSLNIADYQTR